MHLRLRETIENDYDLPMFQGAINKEIDYLNKLQKDETEHQNHRLSWILAAQSILFVGICTLVSKCSSFEEVIVPLIILIGVLLSVSGVFSIIISDTSVGTVYERWADYDHRRMCYKNRPIPHVISSVPPHFMESHFNFLMFYKFAPNVLCSAWLTLLLFYIDSSIDCLNLCKTSCSVVLVFLFLLILICVIVQVLCKYHLYKWRYNDYHDKLGEKSDCCANCVINNPRSPSGSNSGGVIIPCGGCSPQGGLCSSFPGWKIYHIMIDRFNGGWTVPPINSNDFLGGNIRGIIEKLPYIIKQGCNAIMLSPIWKGEAYHGYHITDYNQVDPRFGTWNDFAELVSKAHSYGIKVICDFVPNHCHRNHQFFMEAESDVNSRYRHWFYFDSSRLGGYVSYQNYPDLPKFNLYNPDTSDYMINVALHLIKKYKVDGLRIDHTIGVPFSFLRELRRRAKAVNPDLFIFGEVWTCNIRDVSQVEFINAERKLEFMIDAPDIQDKMQYDYVGILDGVLDFTYMNLLTDAVCRGQSIQRNNRLHQRIVQHFCRYPQHFSLLLFLDNHDTNRFLHYCRGKGALLDEAISYTKIFTNPSITYYGTEQSMCNENSIYDGSPDADLRVREPMDWNYINE